MACDQPANGTTPHIPHINPRDDRVPTSGAVREGSTPARRRPRLLLGRLSEPRPALSFTAGGARLTASRAATTDSPPTKYQYGSDRPNEAKLKNRSTATTTSTESATLCRNLNRSSAAAEAF